MRILNDDELQALIQKIGVVSPRQAGVIDNVGMTTVHERIKNGEYESFLDGASRKITLRSILERRKRLLAAAAEATSPRRPPPRQAKQAAAEAVEPAE
jgi:hypothetical protein